MGPPLQVPDRKRAYDAPTTKTLFLIVGEFDRQTSAGQEAGKAGARRGPKKTRSLSSGPNS